ncbi:hypothetical protein E3N88_31437 [Mikania micrantha]|uniref:Uncharacterized protein n=1 Tax=Mikania micrantha TaxID=192012 RepID=A0A5N6MPW0_9ASTR|nr:hypothetical protein E3N88_31437 [Mikania micrantha]
MWDATSINEPNQSKILDIRFLETRIKLRYTETLNKTSRRAKILFVAAVSQLARLDYNVRRRRQEKAVGEAMGLLLEECDIYIYKPNIDADPLTSKYKALQGCYFFFDDPKHGLILGMQFGEISRFSIGQIRLQRVEEEVRRGLGGGRGHRGELGHGEGGSG